VGPAALNSEHGVQERLSFRFDSAQYNNLVLLNKQGVAVAVDPNLVLDLDTQGDSIKLALFVPSSPQHVRLIQSPGGFHSTWFNTVQRGEEKSYREGAYVISLVRSKQLDIEAVSVLSNGYAWKHVGQFALAFVPIGCFCGIGLSWAVMQVSKARSSLPSLLRTAARQKDFFLEYQPVVDIRTRRIIGAEALVRWRRGDTIISPASFIGLAEESGVIAEITRSVIGMVASDLPRLLELSPEFRVAINVTATDLTSGLIGDLLQELLRSVGVSPQNIVIEATEHSLMSGFECSQVVSGLRKAGFRVAIDDFGIGYSSLASVQKLDLDFLKIDKAFVETIGTDGVTRGVVLHIIEIARSLKLHAIAEGVETESQALFLLDQGVEYAQGWLFGKPMSVAALSELLKDGS
jgi:c-di-GMP phosphodiesterase